MRTSNPAPDPDAYVASLRGWQHARAIELREAALRVPDLDEVVKWRHLVYLGRGPVALIRAEENRVLLGFWRGRRLRDLEPRLKPGGKYEMATLEIGEETALDRALVEMLISRAAALNRELGDPTNS